MDANVTWKKGMSFEGTADSGFKVDLGTDPQFGGDDDGFRPLELMLVSLGGCTGMDVISILQKKRQEVTSFEVRVHAERAADHPKVFTSITVEYILSGINLDPDAVDRAVELSSTKYCPAQAMLAQAVPITHKVTIQ
jgi:putative redox protein